MVNINIQKIVSTFIAFCTVFIVSNVYAFDTGVNSKGIGDSSTSVVMWVSTEARSNANLQIVGSEAKTLLRDSFSSNGYGTGYIRSTTQVYKNGIKINSEIYSGSGVSKIDYPKTYAWVYGDSWDFYTEHYSYFTDATGKSLSLTGNTSGNAYCVY